MLRAGGRVHRALRGVNVPGLDSAAVGPKKNILVVDDSATIRNIVQVYLAGMNCECHEATNGESALRQIEKTAFDLLIVDLNMPELNGVEFVRAVRASPDPKKRSVPVIVLTGEESDDLLGEAKRAGANEVLKKPTPGTRLRETAAALMRAK